MIEVESLSLRAGSFALNDVSFRITAGSYCVLMGRTGSGKTTLLETICGLKTPESGRISLDGRDATLLGPAERNIGYVPQEGALFMTHTVREHLKFALAIRNWPVTERAARVEELAKLLHLAPLLDRYPHNLSGGERQRTALGRALSFKPKILCLDEPLSSLDDDARDEMIGLLQTVRKETGVTALHVTHNRHEAEKLADQRLRIEGGKIL